MTQLTDAVKPQQAGQSLGDHLSEEQEASHDGSSSFSHKSEYDENTEVKRIESKTFQGVPKEWHETIMVKNLVTQRVKLYFKCRHAGCKSVFKKSCNLRDHFRKHTGQRPFTCALCQKTFTQSGNLGRHLKNVHKVPRDAQNRHLQQLQSQTVTISKGSVKENRRHTKAKTQQLSTISDESHHEASFMKKVEPRDLVVQVTSTPSEAPAQQVEDAVMQADSKPCLQIEPVRDLQSVLEVAPPQEIETQIATAAGEQAPHLQNLLTITKLQAFDDAAQMMFEEFGESGRPSAHVLTPMGPQSPRLITNTTQFGSVSQMGSKAAAAQQHMNDFQF